MEQLDSLYESAEYIETVRKIVLRFLYFSIFFFHCRHLEIKLAGHVCCVGAKISY